MMTSADIRTRFLAFFAARGHAILPSAPLVPRNDPSVLFNTAGMQPLVPYLLGEAHPQGVRLASCQKCVRTGDIEETGDNTHLTFFEMLGNWSLGDYFKAEAIEWSYTFLTSKEEGLGLDPKRLYITVFEGDENAPRDTEAVALWTRFVPEDRIYYLPAKNNWWSPGDNGPCGPDTEMFYDVTGTLGDLSHEEFLAADDRGDVVEIWNDVFMEYEKKQGVIVGKLSAKNVDTGSGLERITGIVQGKKSVFETDLFAPAMAILRQEASTYSERGARIIADHIRAAVFLIADGVLPGNKDQGYVLRRLIRRAVLQGKALGLVRDTLAQVAALFQEQYKDIYPELVSVDGITVLTKEIEKFNNSLEGGIAALKKFFRRAINVDPENLPKGMRIEGNTLRINGEELAAFYQTYGVPIEIAQEIMTNWGIAFDDQTMKEAEAAIKKHQEISRAGAEQKFKGGLANTSEQTTKLHTAHHLLLAALQQVLGKEVKQRGSNITDERLRIDFAFDRKMTDEEKQKVESLVNEWITADYKVVRREMPRGEAEQIGAEMEFGTKYPDTVSVYFIEDAAGNQVISKEFCGGPHVERIGTLGTFTIQKEEASSAGIRRIKAVLV